MEREEVLVNWLNEEEGEEITLDDVTNDYGYNYVTPVGDYLVLTEDEAYEAIKDDIENLIDDIGIYGAFSPEAADYVVDNFVTWTDGEDWIREDYYSYLEDIENESSSDDRFSDRLQEELFEECADIDSDDEVAFNEWLADYDDNKERLMDEYCDHRVEEYDNPLDWYRDNFGDSEVKQLVKDGNIDIDYSALADWLIREDGYGNSLAPHDGATNEYSDADGDYWLIFRTN